VADAYAFTIVGWSRATRVDLAPFAQLRAWMERVAARPQVQAAMRAEDLLAAFVFLLGRSLLVLPLGTADAAWTGIGAVGTGLVGVVLFGEELGPMRLGCIALVVVGSVGLKLQAG
jgi:multidrug transporter EmrE-like cation transporter